MRPHDYLLKISDKDLIDNIKKLDKILNLNLAYYEESLNIFKKNSKQYRNITDSFKKLQTLRMELMEALYNLHHFSREDKNLENEYKTLNENGPIFCMFS